MHEVNQISVDLAARKRATITSTDAEWPMSNPVYAINWFDTKSLPLYNLYNALASRSVRAVGGRPHFKGKVTDVLQGQGDDRRDVLLIVNYPSPHGFLDMLKSTYFMMVSVLRMAAVKRFTFGFMRPKTTDKPKNDSHFELAYLVHHFRGEDITDDLLKLSKKGGARVLYAGTLSARVSAGPANAKGRDLQCLMDGIVVFQAENNSVLDEMTKSDDYQSVIQKTSSSFVARMERLL